MQPPIAVWGVGNAWVLKVSSRCMCIGKKEVHSTEENPRIGVKPQARRPQRGELGSRQGQGKRSGRRAEEGNAATGRSLAE